MQGSASTWRFAVRGRQQAEKGTYFVLGRFTPLAMLLLLTAVGLALTAIAVSLAVGQPTLGMALSAQQGTGDVLSEVVRPSERPGVPDTLLSIGDGRGSIVQLHAGDLVAEPDTLDTYAAMEAFFGRQTEIFSILQQPRVWIQTQDGDGKVSQTEMPPSLHRPLGDLPAVFWGQIFVGFSSFLIGAWVWCLRREDIVTKLFALTGVSIMASAYSAGIYSTRELAIDGGLFRVLSAVNHAGALAFGALMIALLLSYPRQLVTPRWLALPVILFGAWWLADTMWLFSGPQTGIHLPVVIAMAAIVVCTVLQFVKTKGNLQERAVLRWFNLGVLTGAGGFVATIIAPNLFGLPAPLAQGYAFLFFLLIYAGLALGVARYRLFDLDRWAFRILFYLLGAALLIALDAVLIYAVALDRTPAFGLALLAVGLLYLPCRDMLAHRFSGRRPHDRIEQFQAVVEVALAPSAAEQEVRWKRLLASSFHPLQMTQGESPAARPRLQSDGLRLEIPSVGTLPSWTLDHAYNGRKLFSTRDAKLALELCTMLTHSMGSRRSFDAGVTEERSRIARDMHDNIGVQLLGALHSREADRKDGLIREALADLRDIINNASSPRLEPAEIFADLRIEISEHLEIAGIELDWVAEVEGGLPLLAPAIHALRSIIREASGNAIKHAGATRLTIDIRHDRTGLALVIADNGKGFDPAAVTSGNGLTNMRTRMSGFDGSISIDDAKPGTRIAARFPPVEA